MPTVVLWVAIVFGAGIVIVAEFIISLVDTSFKTITAHIGCAGHTVIAIHFLFDFHTTASRDAGENRSAEGTIGITHAIIGIICAVALVVASIYGAIKRVCAVDVVLTFGYANASLAGFVDVSIDVTGRIVGHRRIAAAYRFTGIGSRAGIVIDT